MARMTLEQMIAEQAPCSELGTSVFGVISRGNQPEIAQKPAENGDQGATNTEKRAKLHNYPRPSKKTHKRCVKCRCWRVKGDFGAQAACADGLQSYCKYCKNELGKKRRQKDLRARIRHHFATRITDQLGPLTPPGLSRNLDEYLGYGMGALIRHLREDLQRREGEGRKLKEALDSGYHIDHLRPLTSFPVIKEGGIDWDVFRECWAIENLSAIPAEENLKKGARYDG